MLPLHGQGTAAVEYYHWAELTSYKFQEAMFLLNSRINDLPSSFFYYPTNF